MRMSDDHDELRATTRYGFSGAIAASTLMLTLNGSPLIYNGMEVGDSTQSGDPALFEPQKIFWGAVKWHPEYPKFYEVMTALRRDHPALQQGATIWLHNTDEQHVVTYLRRAGSEEFLIAVNLSNTPFRGSVEAAGNWKEIELPVSKRESEAVPFLSLNAFEARIFQKQSPVGKLMTTSQTEPVGAKTVTYFRKPERSFWQIWNMSFGFLGIQFGWGLQMANMSAIYEYLGARADQIPILWLAAPLTGLLIQPLIGHASDHTWGRLGRRRPYFLAGAILSSLMLLFMPNASALWMAAGMLWILDASINVSMEPFRAFVADILPEGQRTSGFAMQSLFIGLGASFSSALPYILTNVFHMQQKVGDTRAVPTVVRISFYVGAVAFIGAVLWTIITTKEYPPQDMEAFRRAKAEKTSLAASAREIFAAIAEMPDTHAQARTGATLHVARSLLYVALFPGCCRT